MINLCSQGQSWYYVSRQKATSKPFIRAIAKAFWTLKKSILIRVIDRYYIHYLFSKFTFWAEKNRDGSKSEPSQQKDTWSRFWAILKLSHLDFSCIWLHVRHVSVDDFLSHLTIPLVVVSKARIWCFVTENLMFKNKPILRERHVWLSGGLSSSNPFIKLHELYQSFVTR